MFCTQILIINQNKYLTIFNCYFINCNAICTQLLPLVIISPLHNKQDSGHIDVVVSNFSRFKDILDLEYRVLYFSIMEKTHIEIVTNIMGKECVLYMQPYNNLPRGPLQLPPCCPSRGGLS